MVVAVFVGSLGISGLLLKKYSDRTLIFSIALGILFLAASYIVVPYLPMWVSNARALMTNHEAGYPIFYVLCFCFLALTLFPGIYFSGRLLPMSYALSAKNGKNFGRVCSLVYFFNTLGTFVGSVFIGHLLMEYISIDQVYRLAVGLIIVILFVAGIFYCPAIGKPKMIAEI